MDSRTIKGFLAESLAWLAVALMAMFLVQPRLTSNALEKPYSQPVPIIIAFCFGPAAAFLRRELLRSHNTLRARTLVLEDSAGKERVHIDAGDKFPVLTFSSADGFPHLILSGDEKEPSLRLFGGSELKASADLTASENGPSLEMKHGLANIALSAADKKAEHIDVRCRR